MEYTCMNPELQDKVRACESPEDILALAKSEGYELSDGELSEISGGDWSPLKQKVQEALQCPDCGSYEVVRCPQPGVPGAVSCRCMHCGRAWVTIGGVLHT